MPAFITHYLCGNSLLRLIEDDSLKSLISEYRNTFNLGTQGPDIFYYYGAWPWKKNHGISDLGNRLHEEKTGELIMELLMYAAASEADVKEMLTAYISGYICHYMLDCHTHPYVFYRTGFVRSGEAPTSKYTCYHRMFETALDVLMLRGELGKKPYEFDSAGQIRIPARTALEIGKMYSTVLNKVYQADISAGLVQQAIADTVGISAVLRDKTGIKKGLFEGLEKGLKKPPLYSSMFLPSKIEDKPDYLNSCHSLWYLPWDNSKKQTSSFTDNFFAAAAEAKNIVETAFSFLAGHSISESLASLIGNRSFTTGEDCTLGLELKYFDCIYE